MPTYCAERSDGDLIRAAAQLVHYAQRFQSRYASGTVPASTSELWQLLRGATCRVYEIEPRPGARAIVTPPIAGYYRIGIKRDLSVTERAFALRHELGHVLAGDAEEPVRLVDRGYLTWAERLADLFALADLVPGRLIATLRRIRMPWADVRREIERLICDDWGPDWHPARVDDRARLRIRLYRECGI
jgi:hypothetical protein